MSECENCLIFKRIVCKIVEIFNIEYAENLSFVLHSIMALG